MPLTPLESTTDSSSIPRASTGLGTLVLSPVAEGAVYDDGPSLGSGGGFGGGTGELEGDTLMVAAPAAARAVNWANWASGLGTPPVKGPNTAAS